MGVLVGSWLVVCSQGHVDQVDGMTSQHDCEQGPEKGVVDDGRANVKCSHCGSVESVSGVTSQHTCKNGHKVRLD